VKLTDLHPQFIGHGGEGVFTGPNLDPVPRREGVGLICDCPCGKCDPEAGGQLFIPFANPLDGGPNPERQGWQRTGETFETMTLSPSILRSTEKGGCGWHGWIRDGGVITC
jgi:hypothetical protein